MDCTTEKMIVKEALSKYQYEMIRITTSFFDDVLIGYHWQKDPRVLPICDYVATVTVQQSCSYNVAIEL